MSDQPIVNSAAGSEAQSTQPSIEECLHAAGLDVEYIRGEGDYLYYENGEGEQVQVLDLVGGYGASLFGHNNPRIVGVLSRLLQEQRPFNSQGSIRAYAKELSNRLSQMAQRETEQAYSVVLESTGSAAVEAAIKHAELEFQNKLNRVLDSLFDVQKQIRVAARKGPIAVSDEVIDIFWKTLGISEVLCAEDLIQASIDAITRIAKTSPVVLSLEGGFHGKSTGALSLTANQEYRTPWKRLGFSTTFVPKGDIRTLDTVIDEARFGYVDLSIKGQTLSAKPAELVAVIAAFAEPIQGEGGVLEVERKFLQVLRNRADEAEFPLVFDEIQSGMGRTGTFLAATPMGVVADYVLLSKALGGGLCKVSALLIHRERYLADFGLLHTSTFAGDDHSSAVALEALSILDENDGALMQQCVGQGAKFIDRLKVLENDYPTVIEDVRGYGLLMAVELIPREDTSSVFLRWASEQGLLGYVVAGHLLREHGVRMAPTLSNPNTLRIQPSAYVGEKEIEQFVEAFEQALRLLQADDSGRLMGHLVGRAPCAERHIRPVQSPTKVRRTANTKRVAFLAHLLEPQDARTLDSSLKNYSADECGDLLSRMAPLLSPFVLHRTSVGNDSGTEIDLSVIGVPFTSEQVMEAFRSGKGAKIRESVFEAVELARREGAEVIGFGGYTSIATSSCLDVIEDKALITSGNSVTAAAGIHATMQRVEELKLTNRRLGVVGAAGNLGCVIAEVMAPSMDSVLLVGRQGAEKRLERRVRQIKKALGEDCPIIEISTNMADLASCGVIMTATNSPVPVIFPEHVSKEPTVICDIATPGDVDASVVAARPNADILKGGIVSLPGSQDLTIPGMNQPRGHIYGCLAETILLGLDNAEESPSIGLLTPDGIRASIEMVKRHGFGFDPWPKAFSKDQAGKLDPSTDFIAA